MDDCVDQQALSMAQQIAEEYQITDPKMIALIQLGAVKGIMSVPVDNNTDLINPIAFNARFLAGLIFDAALPKDEWSQGNDDSAIALNLARQRRFVANRVKQAFIDRRIEVTKV